METKLGQPRLTDEAIAAFLRIETGFGDFSEERLLPSGIRVTHRFSLATGFRWLHFRARYRASFGEPPEWLHYLDPYNRGSLCNLALKSGSALPENPPGVLNEQPGPYQTSQGIAKEAPNPEIAKEPESLERLAQEGSDNMNEFNRAVIELIEKHFGSGSSIDMGLFVALITPPAVNGGRKLHGTATGQRYLIATAIVDILVLDRILYQAFTEEMEARMDMARTEQIRQ